MDSNNTMKTTLIAIITLAFLTPVAANAEPVVNDIHIQPESPEEGETVRVSLEADDRNEADLITAQARIDNGDWKEKSCDNPYSCDGVEFSFQPDQGEHDIDVRVMDSLGQFSSIKSGSVTVESKDTGSDFGLSNVESTRFKFSKGQNGQLQADVENKMIYNAETTVKWYAVRNGQETEIASRTQWVDGGSTDTLARTVSWYQLQSVIDEEKDYTLKAKLYYSGNLVKEGTASHKLRLEKERSVQISDYSANYKGDGMVRFRVELNQDVGDFSCRVSTNDRITTADSPVMKKVSGSERDFTAESYYTEGTYTRYMGCLNENNEQVTDAKKVTFTVSREDQKVSIDTATATHKGNGDVRFFLKLNKDVSSFSCRVSDNDQITTADSPVMNKISGSDMKFEATKSFGDGSYTRYLGCLDENNDVATDAQKVSFSVDMKETKTKPQIDLRSPSNGATGVSRNPVYRWKITDSDDNQMADTTIYVEEKHFSSDKPWNQPVHKYDVNDAVGSVQSYSSTTTWLDPNKKYVWGVKADDGDHVVRSETYSFKTRGTTTGDQQGSLKVTVRDGENDRLENAHVRIKNGNYRTGRTNGIGKVKFTGLDPAWYDIRVRCDGETKTDRIHVYSNEDETITLSMDQNSDDDYCGDESDDSEPEASFTVSDTNPEIGERVTFDASASNGNIMEYRWSFPDGTTKYGKTVSRSFDSAGDKKVQLRVTEYDQDQDTHSRTITVQRRDSDDGEGSDAPTARLDINPSSAEIGEEIEFDATDSSDEDDIEEYEFDLDGDGDWDVENDGGTVERSFFQEFDGEARVRVTDEDGNTDTADASYEIQARSRVSISNLDTPDKVCQGENFEASFQVRNLGDNDRFVVVEGRGFGSRRSAVASLDEDERRSMSIKFTAGSPGSRTITLSAANSNTVSKTIEVLDCQKQADEVTDLSVSVNPQRVNAGESVKVSGYVENARGREDVRILVDGSLAADISTQPDGYYSAYVYPEEVGRSRIVVSSGGKTVRSSVEVLPTVQMSSLEVKNNIFQGETFEICAQVNSQVDPLVVLTRNGERIASTHDRGRVCFDTVSNTAGETEYKIGAYAKGAGDSISRKVEILETKPETSSFPEQIASVESGDGIVKATIYNNHQDQRRYDVQISGLPNTWTSTTEKQVILQPGEQREVFFYLTPQEEGQYRPEIKIDSRGTTIYETKVDVISGGTSDPRKKSLLERLRGTFPW